MGVNMTNTGGQYYRNLQLIDELYSDNPEENKKIWEEIDSEKNSPRNICKRLIKIAQHKRNIALVPQKVNYENELFRIINDSNAPMRELEK